MQWRKLARSKITSGRSRTRNMLCCGRRKDNGREALDLTASPLRAPPAAPNSRTPHPPPMVIQGDFRKVSGISSEIFKQIETVENDHDASTAAALDHVERRGEMIVRILEARQLGRTSNGDAVKRFTAMQDAKHTVQFVEIVKRPGQTLGLYIREGNGIDRNDGVFISRIALESAVYNSGCLKVGDEILAVNLVDVTKMSLDDVVIIMSIPRRLVLATRQRKASKGGQSSPSVQPRAEHKPPPVVVIKRELREDETDDGDLDHRDSIRQRHTGDGREMSESRSRLGLGLSSLDSRHSAQQNVDSNGLDLYYNSRPPDTNWGYQPPPPVITEQPKSSMQHFQPYERSYPNTLESLAEKVHSFGMNRRMSAGGQPLGSRISSQQSPSSHYYVQHSGTGSRRIMPRSGSDQHLPQTEYSDYTSITQAGRHSLLRSSLKSGSTLSRYNQRYVDQAAVAAQIAQAKYGTTGSQYSTAGTMRRTRGSLDYSSDTEATSGRAGYYYYSRNQSSAGAGGIPHTTIPTLGRQNSMGTTDITTKFNSLPRDTRAATRLAMNKRYGDRSVSLIQDEADGALSAPEMPSSIRRDRGGIPSSTSVFSSDEYRQWLSRTPSTSAIYEQIRASRDVLNQQRAARFTYSAENIHDALKNMESGLYSGYGRPGATSTLDRHFTRSQTSSIPARSLSTQHITSALSSSRSPSMRRMRQLLDLDSIRTGAPSPVPTPSGTLPRGQRQLDINPAEFLKYKLDKPAGMVGGTSITGLSQLAAGPGALSSDEPISGMLWVHLLAGRGLRPSTGTSTATTPVTPSGGAPSITGPAVVRDLYCVLECDRVHKARTVVRTGDLVFDWDESFELDLVNNRELDLLIYSWDPQYRHKLCYKGSVYLPTLLKSGPIHQLALKIEPRGTLYLRLRHTDSQTLYRRRALSTLTLSRTTPLFGVDLDSVVNRENKTGGVPGGVATGLVTGSQQNIPIIIRRCVEEVERRGLDIIGLYRLCGSATKKRILREAFERNSRSVDLSPDNVPDINVITGVLKDYLRELPEPLFTKCLYQMMVDALSVCLPDDPEGNAKLMFSILDCLPRTNRATLIFLMDHLALVVSASDRNKMSAQNLATALAPPLMLQTNDSITPTATSKPHYEIDYQQPINVLKYLLQIWPTPKHHHSDRSARQAIRAAWRQSQCVSSGSGSASGIPGGGPRAVSALSGSVSSSSSLSSLGPARPTATGPITPDTNIVGCFNLPHKNSPLQKVPESPDLLDTKFYLFTRETDLSKPDILYYEDNGRSINGSSFNASNPLKVIVHGYTSRWNEKGSMIMANIYLKMYDCNVILMDWYVGARGPNYPIAAANTELVGRQLGILLTNMVRNGLDPRKIHLIGFSLGAHVCGTASESLKNKGHLLGRITGLDPASPLFRNDYLREKYKKLDRSDAKLVDVIHTDSSPYVTDGFGLYEPIGHVDFFPNGGQDQPGCNDVKDSIVVSHFERGLSQDLVCSHVRAFLLYRESLQNLLDKKYNNKDSCEFIAYNCPREKVAFQEGSCFPQIANDSLNIDPSYRTDIGRIGEDVKGEGVMFLSTRGESLYCGTQIQASVELSNKSGPLKGILQIQLSDKNHFKPEIFQMNCEFKGTEMSGKTIYGLGAMKYKSISNNLSSMQAKFNYVDTGYSSNNQSIYTPVIYFNKVMIRDMYGNSWEYCQRDTRMMNPDGPLTMTKNGCSSSIN